MFRLKAAPGSHELPPGAALLSPPNLLSALRLIAAPVQLWLAWEGRQTPFLVILIAILLTDAADGFLARRYFKPSRLGAVLDSWGDFATYLSLPLCIWWLWPGIIGQELPFVILALTCYVIPTVIGFIRFGRLTSFHTWSAKASTILMAATIPLMLLGGPHWPFRVSMPVLIYAAIENAAIALVLKTWRPNVHTLRQAVHHRG